MEGKSKSQNITIANTAKDWLNRTQMEHGVLVLDEKRKQRFEQIERELIGRRVVAVRAGTTGPQRGK